MVTKPPPDALMFKEDEDGFTMGRVLEHRVAEKLKAGWVLLLSEAQARSIEIEDCYRADLKERR